MKLQRSEFARLFALAAAVVGLAATAGAAIRWSGHELVVNDSPSMPRGFYWITEGAPPTRRGDIVLFHPAEPFASMIYRRGWLPGGTPLLKSVGARGGTIYCIVDHRLVVDGDDVGPVFARDATGNPLPQLDGCHRVEEGTFLPIAHYDRSFDGRYMGAVPIANVIGTGVAVLTF